MEIKLKISTLVFQVFFYSYFIAWSLVSFYTHPDYKNSSNRDNDPYLTAPRINASLFTFNEENKRTRYSQEINAKIYYAVKYLTSFPIQTFKLTGNFHFIQQGEFPVIINVYSLIDLSRPPPFIS